MLTQEKTDAPTVGQQMHDLIARLYPICRSITGNGVRETLQIIREHIPLTIHEVPTGTPVFDWTVPMEWNVRDAYVKNSEGERVIDFRQTSLHLLNHSVPVHRKMRLKELKQHLFTLPDYPDWIPYKTSYYSENWGFCLSHNQLLSLPDDEYEVCIDTSITEGSLTYGECYLPGDSSEEVLITCHVCHPSLANDNLSGISLSVFLGKYLQESPRRYSYRLLFLPATIGAITWLAQHEEQVSRIQHGWVNALIGVPGTISYKKSRRGDAEIDQVFEHVLKHAGKPYEVREFFPIGYDERQFCSPGFNLPVGNLTRLPADGFPQSHTSADNLELVKAETLAETLTICKSVVFVLEYNHTYVNQFPKGEPQLGRRGLYKAISGRSGYSQNEVAMLWLLNQSDGTNSLLDIADKASLPFEVIGHMAGLLVEHGLLK